MAMYQMGHYTPMMYVSILRMGTILYAFLIVKRMSHI